MKLTRLVYLTCIIFVLTLVGCGDVQLKKTSDDFVGTNIDETVSELKKAGFSNIVLEEIDDLTSDDPRGDGCIESISINGIDSFDEKNAFPKDSEIVLVYHIVKKISFPLGNDEIEKKDYLEIEDLLIRSGFTNVTVNEVYDLDPDEAPNVCKSEVIINGIDTFMKGDAIPFDVGIVVNCHLPYEKYTLKTDIHCIGNLIFDKYDVDFKIDGEKIATISHGKDWNGEIRLKSGTYRLLFTKAEDAAVKGEVELDVTSDIEARYIISCHSDYVSVEKDYIDRKTELAEGQVKMPCTESNFKYKDYKEIIEELKQIGFSNIIEKPLYDIIWGVTDVGETAGVTIDGKSDYKRGDVFDNDAEVIISYHLDYDDDPVRIEEAKKAEEAKAAAEAQKAEDDKKGEESQREEITYTKITVQEMESDLESNALKAKEKYEGQYLEITGYLINIDSSGKYISLYSDAYSFTGVQCYIKNDMQKKQVANMALGDTVTVKGKCKRVGEIMGYSFDIDSIIGYEEGGETEFTTTDDGYIVVSANDLVKLIDENPLKARNVLKGQNVEISGKLGTIDSNGKYISIEPDDEWNLTNIQCYIKNDEQKAKIMDMSSGNIITIRGKCKDVGELLGFSIDIESIR